MQELYAEYNIQNIVWLITYVLIIILAILNFINRLKIKKLSKRYEKFMAGVSDRSIEELLDSCIVDLGDLKRKNKDIENKLNSVERKLVQSLQKVGTVRYNAFENVGSDLSFSVALLDHNNDGIVISSIYSRESSTTYAKPIFNGQSKYILTGEEIQALNIAIKNHNELIYKPVKQEISSTTR